ncbi:MAG: DUF1549 domain-containing protein, partial [Gemmataceae bacterium]|nr:DUF1549 domain-containing protein [Gemmataceae bacterium]
MSWIRTVILILAVSVLLCPLQADDRLRDVIDREIKTAWAKEKITAPIQSSDTMFLRRIYLDLVGMIPTYAEATAFLGDTDPKKREKLIDKLLADPRYARQQAQVFDLAMLTRNHEVVEGPIGHRNRGRFRDWLAKQFDDNEPYDRLAGWPPRFSEPRRTARSFISPCTTARTRW